MTTFVYLVDDVKYDIVVYTRAKSTRKVYRLYGGGKALGYLSLYDTNNTESVVKAIRFFAYNKKLKIFKDIG